MVIKKTHILTKFLSTLSHCLKFEKKKKKTPNLSNQLPPAFPPSDTVGIHSVIDVSMQIFTYILLITHKLTNSCISDRFVSSKKNVLKTYLMISYRQISLRKTVLYPFTFAHSYIHKKELIFFLSNDSVSLLFAVITIASILVWKISHAQSFQFQPGGLVLSVLELDFELHI